jgi:hypothetical protein
MNEQPMPTDNDFAQLDKKFEQQRRQHEREVRDVLRAMGVEQLGNELINLTWQDAIEHEDDLLRRIGWILVGNGQQALWQLVYLEAFEGCQYVLGDEGRFLLHQPRAKGTPLVEVSG